jgi:predicted short-subunit dehydrogenase-like oxidoreductase (DUF2520 family)
MTDVSIIGAGRLGTSLGYALARKGFRIMALSCKRLSSAEESRKIIGQGIATTDNVQTAKSGELVILSLPDDEIEKVASDILSSDIVWKDKFVFHCSGLLSSGVLEALEAKGAVTASIHPNQSFSHKRSGPRVFEGIYFGIEGSRNALVLAKDIVQKLGGKHFILKADDKPLYHAACSIASNFLVVLLDMARQLFEQVGLEKKAATSVLFPLVQGTLNNMKGSSALSSLTGPIIRGDSESVSKHIDALRKFPHYHELYIKMASYAVEMAEKQRGVPSEKIEAMKVLLEDK